MESFLYQLARTKMHISPKRLPDEDDNLVYSLWLPQKMNIHMAERVIHTLEKPILRRISFRRN